MMNDDQIWFQIRTFFFKQDKNINIENSDYTNIVIEAFNNNKFELMRKFVKPIKDKIIGNISDRWHFVGTYHKINDTKELYLDIRFRIYKENIPDIKNIVNEHSKNIIESNLIKDLEYDDTFYQKYLKRFSPQKIEIITETLQSFCNQYLEMITSSKNDKDIIKSINNEVISLLGEICHLILFQSGIDDNTFHLLQALKWSPNKTIIDFLISYLMNKKPLFSQELLKFEKEIQTPKLLEMIKNNAQKI